MSDDLNFIPISTPQLKHLATFHKKSLAPEAYATLINDIRSMYNQFSTQLLRHAPGAERAMAVHQLINPPIQQSTMAPTCAKGCGACCHLEVEITKDEGELLAVIVNDGIAIDREKLAIQAARPRKSADWGLPIREESRCVFLGEDQACQVYEFRPAICRKHVVASDPNDCMREGGKPQPILIPIAEIVLSAALSLPGNPYTSLSKSLSRALKRTESGIPEVLAEESWSDLFVEDLPAVEESVPLSSAGPDH